MWVASGHLRQLQGCRLRSVNQTKKQKKNVGKTYLYRGALAAANNDKCLIYFNCHAGPFADVVTRLGWSCVGSLWLLLEVCYQMESHLRNRVSWASMGSSRRVSCLEGDWWNSAYQLRTSITWDTQGVAKEVKIL